MNQLTRPRATWTGPLYFLLLCLLGCATHAPSIPTTIPLGTYRNPLPYNVPDPFVMRYQGTYYLTGTSETDGLDMWTSHDLVHWTPRGFVYRKTGKSWGQDDFWAPAIVERKGTFYFYYSARGPITTTHDSFRICVATAHSPLGPYHDVAAPMFDVGKATIDVEVFVDDDGKAYLYYSLDCSENFTPAGEPISEIYALPLNPDLISIPKYAKPILCLRPDQHWEGTRWNEAPFVFKHGDTYIMMYSANYFRDPNYAVGYATALSPLGPWTKAKNNPVLSKTATVKGPGHNAVIDSPDGKDMFCIYHVLNPTPGGDRLLAIDRMKVIDLPDDRIRLQVFGPTDTPQPLPSGSPEFNQTPVHPTTVR